MSLLTELGKKIPEYEVIGHAISQKRSPISVYGMSSIHKPHIAATLFCDLSRPILFISPDEERARTFCSDFEEMSGGEVPIFLPFRDNVFHNIETMSREFEGQKIAALHSISISKCPVIATTADALMARAIPPDILVQKCLSLKRDTEHSLSDLPGVLTALGYKRFAAVEGQGQFAVRGDICDIFTPGSANPVRCEFFGDIIDTMNYFDVSSQRRLSQCDSITILPICESVLTKEHIPLLKELLKAKLQPEITKNINADIERLSDLGYTATGDRYMHYIYGALCTALDYIPKNAIIILDDSTTVLERSVAYEHRSREGISQLLENGVLLPKFSDFYISDDTFRAFLLGHMTLMFDSFLSSLSLSPLEIISLGAKQLPAYGGSFDTAAADIENYAALGYVTLVLTGGEKRAENMENILRERGISALRNASVPVHGGVYVLPWSVSHGFEYPSTKLAVISEGQIIAKSKSKKTSKKENRDRLKSFTDLSPGDLVVHENHGVGRFVSIERIVQDSIGRDYIKIAFHGTDFLYVPSTSLGLVSKYIGAPEDSGIKLSKLGGATWEKTKSRAKAAAVDLAEYLIKLYSARKAAEGFAFLPDDDWQQSFEESFPYDETPDQLVSTADIKNDMESPHPMDRLLCGDVGFGKTEVAFRAIMKCILSGKQAALLVPTTVLARQHFITAKSRFGGYPIKIDTLSRFRTPRMQKDICQKLRAGDVDLIIGTHRLLQKDVHYKDLGLLVVDEEQRFGVSHKERIKEMTTGIDVLTLTATPIPRTLNMALSGIRDMSLLEEAPRDRLPVQTYVLEHNDVVINDAIAKELARHGQVYYLHNRIESIDNVSGRLKKEFPNASVAHAHGRMEEPELSDIMNRLYGGEIDILVCTTIIETGIDVPNVNTIIIENADAMGLSQLHQIRGRVGRSHRHAYAYLTYRRGKVLSEIAQKRLLAMREFAEFGAGFKIAMRDLEIRGAGNILGSQQSGHMLSVGYDMYLKLLDEAVGELSGRASAPKVNCTADINVSASIPESYVAAAAERIDLYRRIAKISSQEDYEDMIDELIDRYGDPPKEVVTLLSIALLRTRASDCSISEINHKGGNLIIHFAVPNVEKAFAVAALPKYKKRIVFNAGALPYLTLRLLKDEDALVCAEDFVTSYANI